MKHVVFICFLSFFSSCLSAMEYVEGMDVFLYKVTRAEKGVALTLVRNISNRAGYDNQPSFTPDNKRLLYVSQRDPDQTDIYEYDIANQKINQLTATPYSEYSPVMEESGKTFIAVREGGAPYQSLHRYQYGGNESEWAVKTHTPIGYYAMNQKGDVALWARWANALYFAKQDQPQATYVVGHVLPSRPHFIPGSEMFSFVHRQANDALWIKSYEPKSGSITPVAPVLANNIDYAWTPDGNIVTGKNQQLFIWKQGSTEWQLLADLSKDRIADISRLAVSKDFRYIAVVARVGKAS